MSKIVCRTCGAPNNAGEIHCQRPGCGQLLDDARSLADRFGPLPATGTLHSISWWERKKKPVVAVMLACLTFLAAVLPLAMLVLAAPETPVPPPTLTPPLSRDGLGVVNENGENIGVNDGLHRTINVRFTPNILKNDNNDGEDLIYKENLRFSSKPYITLVIGVAFSSSNSTSQESILQGAYIAQREFNRTSNSVKLRLLIANVGSELSDAVPHVAQQIVQIAKQDHYVVGVLGWPHSSSLLKAIDVLKAAKIPMVSQSASSDDLSDISPYFFHIAPLNQEQAEAAQYFVRTLQATRAVVFRDPNNADSQNTAEDFEKNLGDYVLIKKNFIVGQTNEKDFETKIQEALELQPDVFYFAGASDQDMSAFQDALPTSGPFARLPVISENFGYVMHPNSHDRWYFTSFAFHDAWQALGGKYNPFFDDLVNEFDPGQQHKGQYGYERADAMTILTYDAVRVLLQGVQNAQKVGAKMTPQSLTNGLSRIDSAHPVQGVSGQIAFDEHHDPINKSVVLLYVPGGHTNMLCAYGVFFAKASNLSSKCV